VNFLVKDADGFREAANRTFELNPNSAYTVGDMGLLIALSGDFERGIEILRQGMAWNPLCPGYQYVAASLDHYRRGAYELALKEAKRIAMPDLHWDPMLRAAALGQLGRRAEANEALGELLALTHDFVDRARFYIAAYVWSEELVERLLDGLTKAGLPVAVPPPCSAA